MTTNQKQSNMETNTTDVDALKRDLHRQRTTGERFRMPIGLPQTVWLLTEAYKVEVERRSRTYIANEKTEEYIRRVAVFLTVGGQKFGLMFCGQCGNGKTTMVKAMQAAINSLINNNYFKNPTGLTALDAKDYVLRSRDLHELENLRNKKMLFIDDLGREPAEVLEYGNRLNPVTDLIEYRYDKQLFTGFTTNLTPKEIREVYGDRVADRFNEMLEVIVFENKSFRV